MLCREIECRHLHFHPKCLDITESSLPALEPLEKAFAIAALVCKPPVTTNPNPFASKIQNAYSSHVKSQLAPPPAPEQRPVMSSADRAMMMGDPNQQVNQPLTKTPTEVVKDPALTPLEDQKFPEYIIQEYEEYLSKHPPKKQWTRTPKSKTAPENLPQEVFAVGTSSYLFFCSSLGLQQLS